MKNPFRVVGRKTTLFFEDIGGFSFLIKNILLSLPGSFKRFHLIVEQMLYMGVNSLPLILVTSIFTGGVASVQAAYMFSDYVPMRYLGTAVGKSVIMELGPVLTALVVAGRVGASIAAELGTMKVTEQIDALETLALDPVKYLVTPRFVSGIIMLPVLTVFSDFIAILGGLLVSVVFLNVSSYTFLNGLKLFFHMRDLWAGLLKALVFGGIIT
ncbi:MAG TPA: ABC transporter permease, partial [candidate division Zixibacteria bacterium]